MIKHVSISEPTNASFYTDKLLNLLMSKTTFKNDFLFFVNLYNLQ